MATTAPAVMSNIQTKNKLVQYTVEINREFVRENLFSPYMGTDATSIIRLRNEAKKGGEQINFPMVGNLYGPGTPATLGGPTQAFGVMTLTGQEEQIDNYGMRVWIDWARNAVATNDAEEQKDSADIFGEAKPLLSDWGKSLQRDEIILAMMNLPSESAPTNLGSTDTTGLLNGRVNGVPFKATTGSGAATGAGSVIQWITDNADRVLIGNAINNLYSSGTTLDTWTLMKGKIDTTGDTFVPASVSLMKYRAKTAVPKIRPYTTREGREYYVAFAGSANFTQLKTAMNSVGTAGTVSGINLYARPREENGYGGAPNNPLFQDGDLMYDGVIIREVPEIDNFVPTWELDVAGASSSRVAPVFLCGQQAVMMAWGKMATPTFRDQTDYQFVRGVGVKMCYGLAKTFRIPRQNFTSAGTKLVQTGMVTGLFSAATPI
jgi:hypothetical protein